MEASKGAKMKNIQLPQIAKDRLLKLEVGKYNLKPIKRKWYEDGNNFPTLITDGDRIEIAK